jgi:hypothetical protein
MHLALLDGDRLVYVIHAQALPAWHGPAGTPPAKQVARLSVSVGLLDAHSGEWIGQTPSSVP